MALCRVTGTLYIPSGEPAASYILYLARLNKNVVADYGGAVVPDVVRVPVGRDGSVDFEILTGEYYGIARPCGSADGFGFNFAVPNAPNASFSMCIDALPPDQPQPAWLQLVEKAVADAEEAAVDAQAAQQAVSDIAPNVRKNNFTATRAPLPSDDETQGYEVGSRWLWQGQEWVATEVGAGAAVWLPSARSAFASREDAEVTRIPLAVTVINVDGLQYRRASGGTALTTGDGATWEPAHVWTPLHFGARGDGATDDGAAINAALTAYRAKVEGVPDIVGSLDLDLMGRVYVTTVSLDATGLTAWGWAIRNGTIVGKCAGKAVLDLIGSRGGELSNLIVYGDKNSRPSVGIQTARAAEGGSHGFCNNQLWQAVNTRGWFSVAGVWAYGQEASTFIKCGFWNNNPQGSAAFFVGTDDFEHNGVRPTPMQSDYMAPITGDTSYINNKYANCDFRYLPQGSTAYVTSIANASNGVFTALAPPPFAVGDVVTFGSTGWGHEYYGATGAVVAISGNEVTTTIDTSGWPVYPAGAGGVLTKALSNPVVIFGRGSDHSFDTCYIVAYGGHHLGVVFGSMQKLDRIHMDLLCEGHGSESMVRFLTYGAADRGVSSGSILTYQGSTTGSLISSDATTSNPIRLTDVHISMPSVLRRQPKMFDSEPLYHINGCHMTAYGEGKANVRLFASFRGAETVVATGATRQHGIINVGKVTRTPRADQPFIEDAFLDYSGAEVGLYRFNPATKAFQWDAGGNGSDFLLTSNAFSPASDNSRDLGSTTLKYRDIMGYNIWGETYRVGGAFGVTGSFTTTDGKTVTVTGGIVTGIT